MIKVKTHFNLATEHESPFSRCQYVSMVTLNSTCWRQNVDWFPQLSQTVPETISAIHQHHQTHFDVSNWPLIWTEYGRSKTQDYVNEAGNGATHHKAFVSKIDRF